MLSLSGSTSDVSRCRPVGSDERQGDRHMITSTTPRQVVSTEDLELAGFTAAEIDCLHRLKRHYPYVEFTDTPDQWQRLVFLKWRMETGRASD